ncbi:hypothetical protein MRX96_029262 [Rhipicephalus microplus]
MWPPSMAAVGALVGTAAAAAIGSSCCLLWRRHLLHTGRLLSRLLSASETENVLLALAQQHLFLAAHLFTAFMLRMAHFSLMLEDLVLLLHDAELLPQQPGFVLIAVVLHLFLKLAPFILHFTIQKFALLLLKLKQFLPAAGKLILKGARLSKARTNLPLLKVLWVVFVDVLFRKSIFFVTQI